MLSVFVIFIWCPSYECAIYQTVPNLIEDEYGKNDKKTVIIIAISPLTLHLIITEMALQFAIK